MAQVKRCLNCGKLFSKPPSCSQRAWEKRKFCSVKCFHEYKRIEVICPNCGKRFKVPRSRFQGYNIFCSAKCLAEWKRKHPDEYHLFKKGHKGYKAKPWLGKHLPEKTRKKMSEVRKKSPKVQAQIRKLNEKQRGVNHPMYGKHPVAWNKGKPLSSEHLRNVLKANAVKPNKAELRLLSILQRVNPAWRYVGDGSLVIDGKCPDFWDGDKGLVELFGDYWHEGENPQDRVAFFAERGYSCRVIWEHELVMRFWWWRK